MSCVCVYLARHNSLAGYKVLTLLQMVIKLLIKSFRQEVLRCLPPDSSTWNLDVVLKDSMSSTLSAWGKERSGTSQGRLHFCCLLQQLIGLEDFKPC